jgi:hypothetical protein
MFSPLRAPHCAFCTFEFDHLFGLQFLLLFPCLVFFLYLFISSGAFMNHATHGKTCNKRKIIMKEFVTSTKDIYLISSLRFSEDIAGKQSIMKGCHVV